MFAHELTCTTASCFPHINKPSVKHFHRYHVRIRHILMQYDMVIVAGEGDCFSYLKALVNLVVEHCKRRLITIIDDYYKVQWIKTCGAPCLYAAHSSWFKHIKQQVRLMQCPAVRRSCMALHATTRCSLHARHMILARTSAPAPTSITIRLTVCSCTQFVSLFVRYVFAHDCVKR